MKRLIIFTSILLLVFSMSAQAFAATPKLPIPKIPSIPNISTTVQENVKNEGVGSQSFWDKYFAEHPIKINWDK